MKRLLLVFFFSVTPSAHASLSASDLALMPPYCHGTQVIRSVSQDPQPIENYISIYGKSYSHLHHYCEALVTINKYQFLQDKLVRESKMRKALIDIQYSIDRSDLAFVFLPDMYAAKARVLFTLRRDSEAVLALKKAIEVKPDYVPAIGQLSDFFAGKGDKAQAIKILEEGIDNTERATSLIKKLEKLGKTYQGTPGSSRKKEEPRTPLVTEQSPDTEKRSSTTNNAEEITKQTPPSPVDNRPADNPYCRFCP